jgi:predicted TPR repeat methyltransferase
VQDHRRQLPQSIADKLGYDSPEIVQARLTEDENRTLTRALNLACRRQLTQEQRRQLESS